VQEYLIKLAAGFHKIRHIHFYNDMFSFAIIFDKEGSQQVKDFLKAVDKDVIREKYLLPPIKPYDTPYSIVSNALIKRLLFNVLVPSPIKVLITAYRSLEYIKDAFCSLIRGQLNMETLDGSAIAISMCTKQFDMASSIMFILGLGEQLSLWTQKKSFEDLEKSLESKNKEVWVLRDGERTQINCSNIELNDIVIVSEGNEILFDGKITKGRGSVNESSITGEAFPIDKKVGDLVYSNTILESGEIYISVSNVKANARIYQLIDLMKKADLLNDTKQYKFILAADRLVKYNFLGAALTYLFTFSFSKAISFLLVDYSCALKLSTPVAYLSAIQKLIDREIVVKSASSLDIYNNIDTFIFDKTGTITKSHPEIHKIITFYDYSQEEVLRIAACLEEHIYHPIASAVVNKAKEKGIDHPEMHSKLYHIASKGIISNISGDKVVISNLMLLEEEGISISEEQRQAINKYTDNYNLLYLGYKDKLIAIFCVDISLRDETLKVLNALKQSGKELILLTGDTRQRTLNTVENLPFDEVLTEMTPSTKYEYVLAKKQSGKKVLMVGDGLNDSAALSAADISVSMGEGADLSKQVSDILLLSDSLTSLLELNNMAQKLNRKVNANVSTAITVNTSLICMGLFDLMPAKILSILHNLTTFSIVLTSFNISE
jgi:heavy metal translocating P-type ATPase